MTEKYVDDDLTITKNPVLYYKFLTISRSVSGIQLDKLESIKKAVKKDLDVLRSKEEKLSAASSNFMEENRFAMKAKHNAFASIEQSNDMAQDFHDSTLNFVVLVSEVVKGVAQAYESIYAIANKLKPPEVQTLGVRNTQPQNFNDLQAMVFERDLNGRVIEEHMRTLATIKMNENMACNFGTQIYLVLDKYYKVLLERHTNQGLKIFRDPVITDVAIRVYENIDGHGEIESGKNKNEVSAYTLRKAETLAKALKDDLMLTFLKDPNMLISFIGDSLRDIELRMIELVDLFTPQIERLHEGAGSSRQTNSKLKEIIAMLKDANPKNVSYAEPKTIKTESEKFVDDIKNETIEKLVELLLNGSKFEAVVDYVLERKVYLKKYFMEENSFYICKIGTGNQFKGEAPGALYVVPSQKPRGDMKNIRGSNFGEVSDFFQSIESSSKYHSLFIATSPSKSADKSNILMVGPPGCGKSEVMRAVGADKKSIAIFAQGSDFGTAWANMSEGNVKRLFEEGVKLNRESGKHVYFLIDEIDDILNNDMDTGGGTKNLTLEFQILMDGVINYPNLTIVGATNNPERIPMPMLRRFNRVSIVGELNDNDRIYLLKHFMNHMPLTDIEASRWAAWSESLEDSTGDVIRKIADYVWRKKMNQFVTRNPEKADMMVKFLDENCPGGFSVDKFNRDLFKKELGKYMKISSIDIDISIKENLSSIAVRSEINTAKLTYTRAKKLLHEINNVETSIEIPV